MALMTERRRRGVTLFDPQPGPIIPQRYELPSVEWDPMVQMVEGARAALALRDGAAAAAASEAAPSQLFNEAASTEGRCDVCGNELDTYPDYDHDTQVQFESTFCNYCTGGADESEELGSVVRLLRAVETQQAAIRLLRDTGGNFKVKMVGYTFDRQEIADALGTAADVGAEVLLLLDLQTVQEPKSSDQLLLLEQLARRRGVQLRATQGKALSAEHAKSIGGTCTSTTAQCTRRRSRWMIS